jgi:IS5 family transposase
VRRQNPQLSLNCFGTEHDHAEELALIGRVLDDNPRIKELVERDLFRGLSNPETGAPGMTGDQVLRALVIKQMNGYSYDELSFHLADSVSYRTLCGYGAFEKTPSRSTLAENIKRVRQETLAEIHRVILKYAEKQGIEKGRKVRIDSTVVETNIHQPSDSTQLFDGVRVLTRLLSELKDMGHTIIFTNHIKRAKRRMLAVKGASNPRDRRNAYRDLLKVTSLCVGYAERAVGVVLEKAEMTDPVCEMVGEISYYIELTKRVIDQTERRVFRGEKVPADEKVVSLFESHTDIIVKDRRETLYGHKVYLTGGASGLILDCVIERGNPADSSRAIPMLKRQNELYGRLPRQASLDGGFASRENLEGAKALGVEDVCFGKKRGLEISEMVKSTWVYKRLRNFRAGIEGMISFLKRAFGMDRCTWRGLASFGSYVMASVVTSNLLTIARHLLL